MLYEDFPYAWWEDFGRLEDMPAGSLRRPARRRSRSAPEFADISDQLERKIRAIALYESQIERLFDGTTAMARRGSRLRGPDRRHRQGARRPGGALLGHDACLTA